MQCVKCNNTVWFIAHPFISQENVTFLIPVTFYDCIPDYYEIKSQTYLLYENFEMTSKEVTLYYEDVLF